MVDRDGALGGCGNCLLNQMNQPAEPEYTAADLEEMVLAVIEEVDIALSNEFGFSRMRLTAMNKVRAVIQESSDLAGQFLK